MLYVVCMMYICKLQTIMEMEGRGWNINKESKAPYDISYNVIRGKYVSAYTWKTESAVIRGKMNLCSESKVAFRSNGLRNHQENRLFKIWYCVKRKGYFVI